MAARSTDVVVKAVNFLAWVPLAYFLMTLKGRELESLEIAIAVCLSVYFVVNLIVMAMNEGLPSNKFRAGSALAVLLAVPAVMYSMPYVFPKEFALGPVCLFGWIMSLAFGLVYLFVRRQITKELKKKRPSHSGS